MAVFKDFSIPVSGTNPPVAPIISLQPQSQTVAVGDTASFSVTASGTAPLSYQWRFNGTNIAGAGTNLYTLASAQATNNGSYTVVITNIAGAVTSSVATLVVSNQPPAITTQPASQAHYSGETVVFSVVAAGTEPLSYQWRFNGTNISGAGDADYSFNNVQASDAGNYTVVITNFVGGITSAVATLTVTSSAPFIVAQPVPLAVSQGGPASFSVTATGAEPLEYQWRFNGADISGATTNPFTLAAAQLSDAGNYSVLVANAAGSVTSSVAALTVSSAVAGQATNVVISQIYGGGGNSADATYRNDFVELFNPTPGAVNLAGWSIQYASETGSSWTPKTLSGVMAPYSYYLIQFPSGGANGAYLPRADATNTASNIKANLGKLALVSIATALSGANPLPNANIVDFVGYGSTASAFEGVGPVATLTGNTNAWVRKNGGYTDSNNNTNDFTTGTPNPRNSASPANPPALPAAVPVLETVTVSGGQLQFSVSGTAGSNYIVQCATNLPAAGWTPLRTNPAPFTFTETNLSAPQKFYRAVAQ
jgi:hypothetical protein